MWKSILPWDSVAQSFFWCPVYKIGKTINPSRQWGLPVPLLLSFPPGVWGDWCFLGQSWSRAAYLCLGVRSLKSPSPLVPVPLRSPAWVTACYRRPASGLSTRPAVAPPSSRSPSASRWTSAPLRVQSPPPGGTAAAVVASTQSPLHSSPVSVPCRSCPLVCGVLQTAEGSSPPKLQVIKVWRG